MSKPVKKIGALFWIAAFSLAVLEILCSLFLKDYSLPRKFKFLVENAHYNYIDKNTYRSSRLLGIEPIPGRGEYSERGIMENGYALRKKEGVTRILFLGDSVTHRRIYVDVFEQNLRKNFPGKKFEIWNASVEGYNADQESLFFSSKGIHTHPDVCILGFHLNDFTSTPVAYLDNQGQLVIFSPGRSIYKTHLYNAWLFVHSTAYRAALMLLEKRFFQNRHFEDEIYNDTLAAVGRIHALCLKNNIRFLVVVFPYVKPDREYTARENLNYQGIISFLKQNRVDFVDLRPVFNQVGIQKIRGQSGDRLTDGDADTWHPNRLGHELAGQALYDHFAKKR